MPPYLYTPLRPGEFRLMMLVPGFDQDPIRYEIYPFEFPTKLKTVSHVPSYEALSYMWNDPAPPRKLVEYKPVQHQQEGTVIHVGSFTISARNNLSKALYQL